MKTHTCSIDKTCGQYPPRCGTCGKFMSIGFQKIKRKN
jgi:hypothetical protein